MITKPLLTTIGIVTMLLTGGEYIALEDYREIQSGFAESSIAIDHDSVDSFYSVKRNDHNILAGNTEAQQMVFDLKHKKMKDLIYAQTEEGKQFRNAKNHRIIIQVIAEKYRLGNITTEDLKNMMK